MNGVSTSKPLVGSGPLSTLMVTESPDWPLPPPLLDVDVATLPEPPPPPQPARTRRAWVRPSRTSLRTFPSLRLVKIGDGDIRGEQGRSVGESEVLPHVSADVHDQRGRVDLQVMVA